MPRKFATKLLFVCSRNKIRSLTAEKLFADHPGFDVRSAGTQPGARSVVTAGHIGWADMIFAMESSHLQRLRARFPEVLEGKHVITLHIPDAYAFMDEDLIEALQAAIEPHLTRCFPQSRLQARCVIKERARRLR